MILRSFACYDFEKSEYIMQNKHQFLFSIKNALKILSYIAVRMLQHFNNLNNSTQC